MRTKRQALFCAADLLSDSSELGSARLLWLRSRLFAPQAAIEFGCARGKHTGAVWTRSLPAWVRFGRHSGNEALYEAVLTECNYFQGARLLPPYLRAEVSARLDTATRYMASSYC